MLEKNCFPFLIYYKTTVPVEVIYIEYSLYMHIYAHVHVYTHTILALLYTKRLHIHIYITHKVKSSDDLANNTICYNKSISYI